MKQFNYKGKIITASSKQEAITKILADSKKPNIDMKVVNKWMKKNLDITDKGLGKDHWKNPKTGDVYYSWKAAKRLSKKVPGYHLPTIEDWNELAEACGGVCVNPKEEPIWKDYEKCEKLKQLLNIKLAGYYGDSFYDVGFRANFWTSTESSSSSACRRYFSTGPSVSSSDALKNYGYSVRLVKD